MPALAVFLKNMPELKLDKSKRRILLIYVLALSIILIGYFFLFLKPSVTKLFELIPKVGAGRLEIKTVQTDLTYVGRLKKKHQTLNEQLNSYEKRLSREKELPLLLENLSKMARSSRVKILSITPRTSRKDRVAGQESVYQEVPIAVTAQSGYHELGAFINKLENDQRYMQISDLRINANKARPKRHNVEFVIYAYTLKR